MRYLHKNNSFSGKVRIYLHKLMKPGSCFCVQYEKKNDEYDKTAVDFI